MKTPINHEDITIGVPIPSAIYGKDGTVYFREGYVFSNSVSISRLKHLELYHDCPDAERIEIKYVEESEKASPATTSKKKLTNDLVDVFDEITAISKVIKDLYYDIINNPNPGIKERAVSISRKVHQLVLADENKCIGAVHFFRNRPIKELLPVFSIILCDIIAKDFGLEEKKIYKLLKAAATGYICREPDSEKCLFNPEHSEQQIRKCGVTDNEWLDILLLSDKADILQKSNTKISCIDEIYILNSVNRYLQIVLPITGEALSPRVALQKLFNNVSRENEKYYLLLIKQIGIFPPGTFVKLENGNIGIIVKRDKLNTLNVSIKCYKDTSNTWFPRPVVRDGLEYPISSTYDEKGLSTDEIIEIWNM